MTIDKGIQIRNIYYMLAYAFQELRQNNYKHIATEPFENIEDMFAEILYRGISAQLKQGLFREYVARKESMFALRGKLDLNGTIAHRMRQQRCLSCEYDELSENNLFNQIIKTTALVLSRHNTIKRERKTAIRNMLVFFDNVDVIETKSIPWKRLKFDRNNKSYQMLLYICYFVLDNLILSTEDGKYHLKGFSDDHMNRLFEKFILEYYRFHHPTLKARAAQISWNIDETTSSLNMLPIMQTDVLLELEERTLIIDAKYYGKILQSQYDKTTLRNAHLYQIMAYVNNLDIEHSGNVDGMMLYAKTNEEITPNEMIVNRDGNRYFFKCLDLNQDFACIKEQLDKIILL